MDNRNELNNASPLLTKAVEFIWQEAALLDRKDYKRWADLWSNDGVYVIPIDRHTTDFAGSLNYAYDDARMRKLRIERLTSGLSMSVVDSATTVRTVSRFLAEGVDENAITVSSAQVIVGYKRGQHTLYAADLSHTVKFENGVPKLQQKVIRLVNSEDALNALGFLL